VPKTPSGLSTWTFFGGDLLTKTECGALLPLHRLEHRRKRQHLTIPNSALSRFKGLAPERTSRTGEGCTPTRTNGPRSERRSLWKARRSAQSTVTTRSDTRPWPRQAAERRVKAARLPIIKTLETFDFFSPALRLGCDWTAIGPEPKPSRADCRKPSQEDHHIRRLIGRSVFLRDLTRRWTSSSGGCEDFDQVVCLQGLVRPSATEATVPVRKRRNRKGVYLCAT
jgi:hypothetical protein